MSKYEKRSEEEVEKHKRLASEASRKYPIKTIQKMWRSYFTWRSLGYLTPTEVNERVSKDTGLSIQVCVNLRSNNPPDIG